MDYYPVAGKLQFPVSFFKLHALWGAMHAAAQVDALCLVIIDSMLGSCILMMARVHERHVVWSSAFAQRFDASYFRSVIWFASLGRVVEKRYWWKLIIIVKSIMLIIIFISKVTHPSKKKAWWEGCDPLMVDVGCGVWNIVMMFEVVCGVAAAVCVS